MRSGALIFVVVDDHQRQLDAHGRPVTLARTRAPRCVRRAPRRDDGRWRAPGRARRACARTSLSAWRNRLKRCGRNSGAMPSPVSLTVISTCEFTRCRRTCTRPPLRRELDGVGQQIPHHLLQPLRIARHRHAGRSIADCSRTPFAAAAGVTVSSASWMTRVRSTGRMSSRSLPVMMRETSSTSLISCSCSFALRSIVSSTGAQRARPRSRRRAASACSRARR